MARLRWGVFSFRKNGRLRQKMCHRRHSQSSQDPSPLTIANVHGIHFPEALSQLATDHRLVGGVEVAQLLVTAVADNAAVIEYENAVGDAYGAEAVGDNERGSAFHERRQCFLDGSLAFRVERARRLIEDEDGRILEKSPGDGDPLALAAGKEIPTLAD